MALTDKLVAIADAIRAKDGTTGTMTLDQMPEKISKISTGANDEVIEYSQLSTAASGYLAAAKAQYTDDNYASVSIIAECAVDGADDPAGIDLTLTNDGIIHYADEDEPKLSSDEAASAGTHTAYNLVPGHITRWWLSKADGTTGEGGRVKPTGTLRQIYVSGDDNCRDIGGISVSGGTVRYGLIYRGVFPSDSITNMLVGRCHVAFEINLEDNTGDDQHRTMGVGYGYFPLETIEYKNYFDPANINATNFARAICQIMENAASGIPTYVHCSRGCDRTGVVIFALEALLGASGVDLDIDYELTAIMSDLWGGSLANIKRTYAPWVALRNQFKNYVPEGNILDNALYWCGRMGISEDLVTRYRAAMTDGTPAEIAIYNLVTADLTNVTSDGASQVRNGTGYSATRSLATGAAYTFVSVTMGGADITSTAWDADAGTITIAKVTGDISITATAYVNAHEVKLDLNGVTSTNSTTGIIDGQAYETILAASTSGYTISCVVTMGGVDITASAWDVNTGKISIASVTGDISITAAEMAPVYSVTNIMASSIDNTGAVYNGGLGYKDGAYLSSNDVGTDASYFASGFIENQFVGKNADGYPKTLYVRGADLTMASHTRLYFYNNSFVTMSPYISGSAGTSTTDGSGFYYWFHVTKIGDHYFKLEQTSDNGGNWYGNASQAPYFRLSLPLPVSGTAANVIMAWEPIE